MARELHWQELSLRSEIKSTLRGEGADTEGHSPVYSRLMGCVPLLHCLNSSEVTGLEGAEKRKGRKVQNMLALSTGKWTY